MKRTSRASSWTNEEDTLLAKEIITSVRNGKTQGDAYRTVAGQLGRTPVACMLRWYEVLKTGYQTQLETARRERLDDVKPKASANTNLDPSLLLQNVNGYLSTFEYEYYSLIDRLQTLVAKRYQLLTQVNDLDPQVVVNKPDKIAILEQLHEEAQLLVQMVIRANRMLEHK